MQNRASLFSENNDFFTNQTFRKQLLNILRTFYLMKLSDALLHLNLWEFVSSVISCLVSLIQLRKYNLLVKQLKMQYTEFYFCAILR